jgi:hypothetical protein
MSELTERQKELRKKYTRAIKVDGKWTVHMQIDFQGFTVVYDTTKARCNWHRDMLAFALDRLINEERKNYEK